jgi:regulator of sigma E protease
LVTTVVSSVFVIGLLILIHELGHFLVARWAGVGIERFSIGLGPALLRWRGKETEYCLSAIPFLGGYVKMMGDENPLEGPPSGSVDPSKSFPLKPLWARVLIVFAGPGMNFFLAAAIFAAMFVFQGHPVWPPVLGRIQPGGPAEHAGLLTGDRVVAAHGSPVAHWEDLLKAVQAADGKTIRLVVRRGPEERTVTLTPVRVKVREMPFGDEREIWDLGAQSYIPAKIGEVLAGYPAAQAGLRPGDRVTAVDGISVPSWDELAEEIRKRPARPVRLTVERGPETLTLTVTPQPTKEQGPGGEEIEVGKIGISPIAPVFYVRSNPVVAIGEGVARALKVTSLTGIGLWKLITGQLPLSTIGGPIQIAVTAGEQARQGIAHLASFTAVVSVSLALLNLLPIPILDGGHLLFFGIEAVLGRPLSLKKREVAQQVGLFVLLLLMVFATYNDLVKNAEQLLRFFR